MFLAFAIIINNVLMNAPLHTLCISDASLFEGYVSRTGIAGFRVHVQFSKVIR